MGTLHEDVHAFLHAEVTGWEIPTWGIPRKSCVMTSSPSHSGMRHPTHAKVIDPRELLRLFHTYRTVRRPCRVAKNLGGVISI
jgi:hypothetical protein